MPQPSRHIDRRRELLSAWERRCRARGGAEHCSGADALFLVTALSNALRHASETPELGRAARTWGARFSSPVEALGSLSMLRDALTEIADDPGAGLPMPLDVLHRVFDQASLEAVDAASANLRSAARNDPLTGCANRRALDEDLAHAAASARRSNLDLAVAVVDLDGLKQINDTEGHAAGDSALVALVATLRAALREADTLYRTGGDEFVVVAPFTDAAGARALMRRAERIGGPSFSWGVASLAVVAPAAGRDTSTLMDAADADLYERRRSSRRAAVAAVRRRRVTAVASVAASVAVTASMAGLAVALDSGAAAPASHGVQAAGSGAGGAGHWPGATLAGPSAGSGAHTPSPGAGTGSGGTSLVGVLGTSVPAPVVLPTLPPTPALPGTVAGSVPAVSATLPTVTGPVTTSHPIALVSYQPAATTTTAPAPTPTAPIAAASTGPGAGNGGGHGNGNGGRHGGAAGTAAHGHKG